ncbi:MAG TPA: lipopolysaccharide biosynthesis protein [Longimicrobium sp.]|nr:lipopolysaccharide biosynthesis protein [Longimicrobium sp.]
MSANQIPRDDDDTLLAPRDSAAAPAGDDDVTILRPLSADAPAPAADDDQTVLRPLPAGDSAASADDDHTVLRPFPASESTSSDDDHTVLRPLPAADAGGSAREDDTTVRRPADAEAAVKPEAGDTESALEAGVPAAPAAGVSGGAFAGKLKRLGSESLIYGLSTVFGRFLSYALNILYVRYFNPAENGVQSAVYTYAPILSIVFLWGMDVAYMRSAASVKDRPLAERQRAFSMSFAVVAVLGALAVLAGSAVSGPLAGALRLPHDGLLYLMGIIYTDALLAVPYAHLRMTGRPGRYATLRLLFVLISVALNVVLIAVLHWGINAIFLANLVANLAVLLLFVPEVAKLFRPALLRGVNWKPLWAYALPIMPAMFAVMIVENGDRLVLNWLPDSVSRSVYGTETKGVLGIYNFNYKLGVAMLLIAQMFRMAWTPFSLQHGRDPQAPRLFSRVMTAVMLVCATAFLGFALLIPSLAFIPAVYHWPESTTYWNGLAIMPVILLGYVFSAMYAVVTAGLYIEKKTGVLPWIAGAGAAINIAICIVAVRHSMVAVAWATPASYALMAALGAWQSNKVYPVPFEWMRLAHLGAIVAVIFLADQWLAHHGWAPAEWSTVGAKFALLAAFPVLLWATRFLRSGELDVMKKMIRRG